MMLKRTLGVAATALALTLGSAGAAFADHGSDDPPGQHQEHKNGEKHHQGKHKGKHHHRHGQDDGPNHT
jgi:Spy/CpxP family protein refolding chaperone